MAISTYQVYLMHKASGTGDYTKLVDIKSFGDLGGSPEQLDTTTLSDKIKTSILGIQELDLMDFTPAIAEDLKIMDERMFCEKWGGLDEAFAEA